MAQPEDSTRIELFFESNEEDRSLIELLTSAAFYHRETSNLGEKHSIAFGRPWQIGSTCEFGLIARPLDFLQLERLVIPGSGMEVFFYWIIPITRKEREFKVQYGGDALADRFNQMLPDFLDKNRQSVV